MKLGIRGKAKQIAQQMALTGYYAGGKMRVDSAYSQLHKRTARILNGEIKENDWKYWKGIVREKYFDRYIVGAPSSMVMRMREWLDEFIPRVQTNSVTDEDKQILREVFLPYMDGTKQLAPIEYMRKMRMMEG